MKSKYIFGTVAVAAAFSLASCDDFLNDNRYPLSQQVVNKTFWSNKENVQNQVNFFYEDYSGYGNGAGGGTFYWSWLSDDQCGRTAFNDWSYKTVQPSMAAWNDPYTEIRRANLVIEGVESSSLDDATKADFIAQARLHRGRQYLYLVQRFGDVPLVKTPLDPSDDAALFGPRTPRNEVIDFALEDIDFAVNNITTSSNKRTFSSDLAQAVKVELCIYEGAYAKYHAKDDARSKAYYQAAVTAGEAIASRYPINPDYSSLYRSTAAAGLGYEGLDNNSEIIFFKAYEQGVFMNSISDYSNATDGVAGITRDAFNAFLFRDAKPAATTSLANTDLGVAEDNAVSIQNLLDVRDYRLSLITYPYLTYPGMAWQAVNTGAMASSTGYGVSKFNNFEVPAEIVNEINKNYLSAPLFWGARLYTGILEAKAELGTLNDADLAKYMKPLWERAKIDTSKLSVAYLSSMGDPANNMGVSSLIWEIRRLRRCELMLDDNIRYFDLVRWHQLELLDSTKYPNILLGANCSNAPGQPASSTDGYVNGSFGQPREFKAKYYLYPVPGGQIQLNKQLTQNPGW